MSLRAVKQNASSPKECERITVNISQLDKVPVLSGLSALWTSVQ